jgi:transcription-repair coupling factor (superfamily II helicase)
MLAKHACPSPGKILQYPDFNGSNDARMLAQLAQQSKPIAIITASALDAQRLLEEMPFFAPPPAPRERTIRVYS